MTDWNDKLIAFLHDPPEKAYDYSITHRKRAEAHLANLKVPESVWKGKEPDHLAAAADRFIFPATRQRQGKAWVPTGVGKLGEEVSFKHPMSGRLAFASGQFPSEEDAHDIVSDALPAFADLNEADKFWLVWRLWLQFSVTHHHGQRAGAGSLAYLPADTRVPDGTIWHHMSAVSALESTRNPAGQLEPAFLLFQIGPVQEFIAQARSTRDLWSGSYLLSWLMAHAVDKLAQELGPDAVIFPSLRGQPLYDWLNREKLKLAKHRAPDGTASANAWDELRLEKLQSLVLTPNLPHRFLALVPADFDAQKITEAVKKEWGKISAASWSFLNSRCPMGPDKEKLWQFQIENFLQISWQKWPWQQVNEALDALDKTPASRASNLRLGKQVAEAIPTSQLDHRCYEHKSWEDETGWHTAVIPDADGQPQVTNRGWPWSAHYQLLAHRHDARRQTRDFSAWANNPHVPKDNLSGKEEIIADHDWLAQARDDNTLRHLFRKSDRLGAINLIKRTWHRAYLQSERSFRSEEFKFESVPGIAAEPWRQRVLLRLVENEGTWLALMEFSTAVVAAGDFLDFELPSVAHDVREGEWFQRVDASVFQASFWSRLEGESDTPPEKQRARTALQTLDRLLRAANVGRPSSYYAVLALDGDQIGKWLSGEKTPPIGGVITAAAADYFRRELAGKADVGKWLASHRPLSPSYHLQFSESLANFGLYCARRIVEAHYGQLIYAGGDDVLAMLPADEAIGCAQGLRLAFRGSPELAERYPASFGDCPEGFVRLKDGDWNKGARRPAEPSWPLVVPGPEATVSVGLAIGHIKEPLQDMVQEAQRAEKRAKAKPEKRVLDRQKQRVEWKPAEGLDRDALAVTLYKRSGEMIQWGAKFDSKAFHLLTLFRKHYRTPLDKPVTEMAITGKFPYRITEMLAKFGGSEQATMPLCQVAAAETDWVISQQTRKGHQVETDQALQELRDELRQACGNYLTELRDYEWEWEDSGSRQPRKCPRPLCDFYHLFALEAFIARQGE